MTPLSSAFIESLKDLQGVDGEKLIAALDTPPAVSIRKNRRKPVADPLFPEMTKVGVGWCADGVYLPQRPIFTLDPLLHAGAYYVQDASSMIYQQIAERLTERLTGSHHADSGNEEKQKYDGQAGRHLTVLDFCAAPGGKTTAMINGFPDGTVIVSNEFVASRGKILRENLEKWGYPGVITTGAASSQYAGLPEMFDIVAVDAPCSGEGMMRKDEEARRQWSQELVEKCALLQQEILSDLVGSIKPGGFLIYSTCTFNTEEDEHNSRYIAERLGMIPVGMESLGLTGIEDASPALENGIEGLRFMPHLTRGEGLYVSIFRKPGNYDDGLELPDSDNLKYASTRFSKKKNRNLGEKQHNGKKERGCIELSPANRNELKSLIRSDIDPQFELSGSMVTMLPAYALPTLEILRSHGINVTGAGLPVAEIKGRAPRHEVIPDSRLALNIAMRKEALPSADLNAEDTLRYLRGELTNLDENIPRGYVVVTYKGIPLGMMKNLGNRANNIYPKAWRIRIS
ncbi:MAG: rRNA cytosine-C5-methyltransferase [Muribaculaceae bacterium]|nr:rRNA cytosine-C5-methyltransferase [Muribaculaceae bacterium]